jgi:hypothetical protein
MFNILFQKSRLLLVNVEKCGKTGQDTDNNMIQCMHFNAGYLRLKTPLQNM